MTKLTWIVIALFGAAAAVVIYVLHRTDITLKNAQTTADKVDTVTNDVNALHMGLKKTWDDVTAVFQ